MKKQKPSDEYWFRYCDESYIVRRVGSVGYQVWFKGKFCTFMTDFERARNLLFSLMNTDWAAQSLTTQH